ncbi:MAG: hypothetical protein SFW67_26500 [Myxococcaceae bacterium]|nr:hypothetical protein [Myxococcaceae bacterium]
MSRSSLFVALAFFSCGPQTVSPAPVPNRLGVQPNATYFWQVTTSAIEWGECSDAEDFRASASALPVGMNSFLIYKTDAEGKSAIAQNCPRLDPSTCQDSAARITFQIAGPELTLTRDPVADPLRVRDSNGMVRDSSCLLGQQESWFFRDQGLSFDLEINTTLSLEQQMGMECELIENDLKARSPNGLGIKGCVITFRLGGELK